MKAVRSGAAMNTGSLGPRFPPRPGSSLTVPAGQHVGAPTLPKVQPTFSLLGKTAMKMAAQVAEEWTVGPIMASHLTNGDEDALIKPYFNSKLPFQHISPFLTDINDVREPFRLEFMAILETDVNGGPGVVAAPDFERQFKDALERRRPVNAKANEGAEGGGLFQRFIERRRNVKADRVGKPLSKFLRLAEDVPGIAEDQGVWRLDDESKSSECFFFTRPGARELFQGVFHPPAVKKRMALSISQIAMLDVWAMLSGAGKKTKGKGYEEKVLAISTEISDDVAPVNGQPCKCCWTVDVGGLPGDDEVETSVDGTDGPGHSQSGTRDAPEKKGEGDDPAPAGKEGDNHEREKDPEEDAVAAEED